MVNPTQPKLIASGFSLELRVDRVQDHWANCVVCLECEALYGVLEMRSVPFYMSSDEFARLAKFLEEQIVVDCNDRFSFVPTNIGFELSILDADEEEVTVQSMLNVGMRDGNRVYAGSRGQVSVADLRRFTSTVAAMDKLVFTCE